MWLFRLRIWNWRDCPDLEKCGCFLVKTLLHMSKVGCDILAQPHSLESRAAIPDTTQWQLWHCFLNKAGIIFESCTTPCTWAISNSFFQPNKTSFMADVGICSLPIIGSCHFSICKCHILCCTNIYDLYIVLLDHIVKGNIYVTYRCWRRPCRLSASSCPQQCHVFLEY